MNAGLLACASDATVYNATDAYEYPVKPGTEEWKDFTSHDQMLEACQVPDFILHDMSTAGLMETVLNYPLLMDMMAYNSRQQGFDSVAQRFNGLSALLHREDAGMELLTEYRSMDPAAIKDNWTSVQRGQYSFSIGNIETLLAQDSILAGLSGEQIRSLIEVAMEKCRAKCRGADIYSAYDLESTVWLLGKTLKHTGYPPFVEELQQDHELRNFLESGSFGTNYLDAMVILAEEYLDDTTR